MWVLVGLMLMLVGLWWVVSRRSLTSMPRETFENLGLTLPGWGGTALEWGTLVAGLVLMLFGLAILVESAIEWLR